MSSILYPPARPQSIGEVLDSAFRIFKVSLVPCLPYGVLATVAGQLQNIYLIVTGRSLRSLANTDPFWWGLYVLGAILGGTLLNAIFVRQAAIAAGSWMSTSAAFREALRKTPATLGLGVLIVAVLAICFIPLFAVPRIYWPTVRLAFAAVAVCIAVFFLCSWPALLIGRKGVIGSLRYSVRLIRGNWWRTVLIYAVAVTMIIVVSVTAAIIFSILAAVGATRDLAVATAISAVTVVASGAVYMPFVTAMTISLYGDLQARREGIDLERRVAGAPAS
jgi:hypothetical protein